jgi:acyl-CoA thioesterase-2
VRIRDRLPDDPLLHTAAVAYASDMMMLGTATLPHQAGGADDGFMIASLDHVVWFHRPVRADEWMLYHVQSPFAGAARAFSFGSVFRDDGTYAVSLAQEGLFRPLDPSRARPAAYDAADGPAGA